VFLDYIAVICHWVLPGSLLFLVNGKIGFSYGIFIVSDLNLSFFVPFLDF